MQHTQKKNSFITQQELREKLWFPIVRNKREIWCALAMEIIIKSQKKQRETREKLYLGKYLSVVFPKAPKPYNNGISNLITNISKIPTNKTKKKKKSQNSPKPKGK